MGAELLIPALLSAGGTALGAYNTGKTAKREDNALAASIRAQSEKQRQADKRTLDEVGKLEKSSSRDEEAQRMAQYSDQLRRNRQTLQGGLTPGIGGEAFTGDLAEAGRGVDEYAANSAGLMSRVDAAGMQRQAEGFDFGKRGADIGLIGRESRGQAYIDELRRRTIQRNPWLDMAAGGLQAAGMAGLGSGLFGGGNGALVGKGLKSGTLMAGSPAPAYGGFPVA